MKMFLVLIFFFFKSSIPAVPSWNFTNSAINLLTSNNYEYPLYNNTNIQLKKIITRNSTTGQISSRNSLTFGTYTGDVQFESIDSYYENMINCRYLVCPNGYFHPKKFDNSQETDIIPSGF